MKKRVPKRICTQLRLPKEVHELLKEMSKKHRLSQNRMVIKAIEFLAKHVLERKDL